MMEYLYEFWQWVLAISAVLGVISVLVMFRKEIVKGNSKNIFVQVTANIVVFIVGVIVCLSCIVGMLCTKVPRVEGDTLSEASNKLNATGLEVAFAPGMERVSDGTTIVSGQSLKEGSLVLKGTRVIVYLNTMQANGEPELKDTITVPQVVGLEQYDATELLVESGLQFQVWWNEENNIDAEEYYIIDQSIPKGSEVPPGTLVKLELSPNKP